MRASCCLVLVSLLTAAACGDDGGRGPPPGADTEPRTTDAGSDAPAGDATTGPAEIGCAGCTAFVGGRLFDGTTARDAAVVIEGDHVREVVEGAVVVTAGATVDLAGSTLLPGLLDLHVHDFADAGPYAYFAREEHQHDHFRAFLRAGVTTILDVGSPQSAILELRRQVRDGELLAPTLLAAGPMVTATGGHPCRAGAPPGDTCVLIDGATDVEQLMAAVLPDEPDVLKVILERGFDAAPLPRLRFELLPEIVGAAGAAGVPVVAHVSRTEEVVAALDAGIRFFVHMPFADAMTPELCERVASEGAVIVPTYVVVDDLVRLSQGRLTRLEDDGLAADVPEEILDALRNPSLRPGPLDEGFVNGPDVMAASLRTCAAAGVHIAAGTDAGNPGTVHGRSLHWEIEAYVEVAGMSPEQALASATRVAADALGLDDRGRIEPGARADLVVVTGDPASDIHDIENVTAVYLAGAPVDRESLAFPDPASIVLATTPPEREGGDVCVEGETCASGYRCVSFPRARCVPSCPDGTCAAGSVCRDLGEGYACYASDGCDAIAQDCANDASCQWLGDGVTLCLYGGTAGPGESCGLGGRFCATGTQCDGSTCRTLCRPADPSTCPAGEVCDDRSAEAGLAIGFCVAP